MNLFHYNINITCFEEPCSRLYFYFAQNVFILVWSSLLYSTISLSCPKTRRNWGDRAFVSAARLCLWNSKIRLKLKMENTEELFKTKPKTFLMNQMFS